MKALLDSKPGWAVIVLAIAEAIRAILTSLV